MIIGFDFDGTLVESWTATPLPGVRDRLATLPAGTRTFIATNQAGPVWRAATDDPKYPTVEDVARRIADGLRACGLFGRTWGLPNLLILVATYADVPGAGNAATTAARRIERLVLTWTCRYGHATVYASPLPAWRKPGGGMLTHAARFFAAPISEVVYIGDMDSDRGAAAAAGCGYQDAADWRAGAS